MNYLFLTKTPLFNGIKENEIKSVLSCLGAYEKRFKKSETIFRTGDTVSDMGLVLTGSVNITVTDYNGTSTIFSHISKGQLFSEAYAVIPERELLCDVVCAEDAEVLFINVDRLFSVCQNACSYHTKIIRNLVRISAQKNINLSVRMIHTASKRTRSRLLSYFSEQSAISGSNRFTIPFSRQQLADDLGVERSAMSGELAKMKRDGIIDYHKNSFVLLKHEI